MAKFQVPQASIRWLLGNVHVSTPDSEVEADMRSRLKTVTEAQRNACVKYALKCHHENQGLYSPVTTPILMQRLGTLQGATFLPKRCNEYREEKP